MDLDDDGDLDILSGSYSRMEQDMAGLFQILRGSREDDTTSFAPAKTLAGADGRPLLIMQDGAPGDMTDEICTRPFAADIDADGDLDIVTGNFKGTFYLFEGRGKGKFDPTPTQLTTASGPLHLGDAHSDPHLADWDGDGDLDILSGGAAGGVHLIRNIGSRTEPTWSDPVRLVEPAKNTGAVFGTDPITSPSGSTRVWVADVDEDGKLDLLVGDSATIHHAADGLSDEEAKRRDAEWQKAFDDIIAEQQQAFETDDAQRTWSELYMSHQQARLRHLRQERTGFVWLYLAK